MEGKTQYRISMGMSVVLIIFATVCDALSLIPFVGDAVSPIFWIITTIYLWIKGVKILAGSKLATTAISFVGEMIPGIQEFPILMGGIIAILFIIRAEDKTGLSLLKPMSKGITPPRLQRNPFNGKAGVRPPRKTIPMQDNTEEELDMAA